MHTKLKWKNPIENKNPTNTHQIIKNIYIYIYIYKTHTHQTVETL